MAGFGLFEGLYFPNPGFAVNVRDPHLPSEHNSKEDHALAFGWAAERFLDGAGGSDGLPVIPPTEQERCKCCRASSPGIHEIVAIMPPV
jgi:hypothetical protein